MEGDGGINDDGSRVTMCHDFEEDLRNSQRRRLCVRPELRFFAFPKKLTSTSL